MTVLRRAMVLAFMLVAGAHPVVAQMVDAQGCADMQEQIVYLVGVGAFVQEAGLKEGVDLLANAIMVRNAVCGTPGDQSIPLTTPATTEPPPTPAPRPTPIPATPIAEDDNSATRRDACLLVTDTEVGTALSQDVVANETDPAGTQGVQGCEFNGPADAYADVMYFQASGAFVYDAFHATAEANGVDAIPGLGDRAFSYTGGNGPGIVVAKGDKVFTIEFSGIGNGLSEKKSLLALAQQAVGRVH